MRRIATALAAVILLTGGSYVARALTADDTGTEADRGRSGPSVVEATPRLAELNRLIMLFEDRVTVYPDSLNYRTLAGFHLDRARVTGDTVDYRRAVTLLEEALVLSPGQSDAERRLAGGLLALHRFDRALELARSRLLVDPLDADMLLLSADAHLEKGNSTEARTAIDRLELFVPDDPAVLVRRAELAHLAGDQLEAIDHATRALAEALELGLEGRSLAFYYLFLADLRVDAGDQEAALRLVESALDLDEGWAEAHAAQAGVSAAMGDVEAAIAAYSKALELRPDDPEWLAARAGLLAAIGRGEAGADDLARAVEILKAEDPIVFGRSLARLYADYDIEPAEAVRLAEDDLRRRQDVLAYDTYAWALYRDQRYAEAFQAITPVIEAGIHDAEARFHIGMIAAAVGDTATAVSNLRWVLDVNPNFHPLLAEEARTALSEAS